MKRSEAIKAIANSLGLINGLMPTNSPSTYWLKYAESALNTMEQLGMKPPTVRVSTPLGVRIYLDVGDWEENINIDEAGYDKNNPYYSDRYKDEE